MDNFSNANGNANGSNSSGNGSSGNGSSGNGSGKEPKLVDVVVSDQNSALNLMVSFLNLAQKRGSFTIDESAKIYECIKVFSK